MSICQRRICVAAIALFLAIGGVFTAGFVFSGDATLYARFVAGRIRHWLFIATFASTALVVSVPVLWRGRWWQRLLAILFILLAALILEVAHGVLA